jgi:hypothetical protein
MKTTKLILFLSPFLASIVEGVEALTVVLATGTTRGGHSRSWRERSANLEFVLLRATYAPFRGSMSFQLNHVKFIRIIRETAITHFLHQF